VHLVQSINLIDILTPRVGRSETGRPGATLCKRSDVDWVAPTKLCQFLQNASGILEQKGQHSLLWV
jgi:hypothetical protein